MLLMCKDVPVYDIETEKVLNEQLLPGLMLQQGANSYTFARWMKFRYSSGTNTIARKLKGITFGQGARMRINRETRALSFSDCYWLKDEKDPIKFSEISPYYQPFWDGSDTFSGQAAPTLYVGGAMSKEWKQDKRLYKYGDVEVELECIRLCDQCGIPVEQAEKTANGIAIFNITSPEYMLEQADESGRLDPDEFDETTVVELFGKAGVQMLILDAIIGNGDRHAGNFGWLRDTQTGEYISMAPLYDFDHALDSKLETDRLLTDAVKASLNYKDEVKRIAGIASESGQEVFVRRANTILRMLDSESS